jgi:spore coat protein A
MTGPSSALTNTNYNYSVQIKNTGIASSGVTSIKTTLATGVSYVSATASTGFACNVVGQIVTCNRSTAIATNEIGTIGLTVKAASVGSYISTSSVSGGGAAATATASNTVSVISSAPDLVVSIAQPVPALVSTALSEIPVTVSNVGTSATASTISVSLPLPTGVSAPRKFARNADAWVCLAPSSTITCTYGKSLAIGSSTTVRLPVTPAASTLRTVPGPFTATVAPLALEVNTTNNSSIAMLPATVVASLNLTGLADPTYSAVVLDPVTIPKYAMPLPNALAAFFQHTPNTTLYKGYDTYSLDIKLVKSQILPPGFPATDVFAYGDPARLDTFTYPAHTIVARSTDPTVNTSNLGKPVKVRYNNTLAATSHLLPVDHSIHGANGGEPDIRTVGHLHGAKVIDQNSDGYPEAWSSPNGQTGSQFSMTSPTVGYTSNPFNYTNKQEATLQWYHDHTLGMTRLNVYAGLEGLYMLRDDNEMAKIAANQLPGGAYEIPLVLQDRMFHPDGSLAYPDIAPAGTTAVFPSAQPEYFGTVMVVNGVSWPFLEVEPRKYRFRLLNGSSSRFYRLTLSNGASFQVIGTEGGFLNAPTNVTKLTIGPAERYDLIVDFTNATGQTIRLNNSAEIPFPGDPTVGLPGGAPSTLTAGLDDQIMQFRVNQALSTVPNATIPASLRTAPVPTLTATAATRKVLLAESVDNNGRILPILGTVANGILGWMDTVTETPVAGSTEIWEIYNNTVDAHPIHLHGGHFQVLNRQGYTATVGVNNALTNIVFPGPAVLAQAEEKTWKETVISYPDQVTRIIVKFENAGQFVWHCHIIEHEDHDMMRPMQVQ